MEAVEKILNYKTWSDKKKIDQLLEMDCANYATLGTDSAKKERLEIKKTSKVIYKAIKELNPILGNTLLSAMDKDI
jgi:hypothetical protein